MSWEKFRSDAAEEAAQTGWDHLVRSHYFSVDKARRAIGYSPRYEPEEAVLESERWLIDHNQLKAATPLKA